MFPTDHSVYKRNIDFLYIWQQLYINAAQTFHLEISALRSTPQHMEMIHVTA